jgi:uncharacterized ParB-like nuclease family protein
MEMVREGSVPAKEIPLHKITRDKRLQMRDGTNPGVVKEYAECLGDLPPCKVVTDGKHFWLTDGWHTYEAHKAKGRTFIRCFVREGTYLDALIDAAGANHNHGLRRTNDDKRRAVEVLLCENESGGHAWSQSDIARMAHVTHQMVSKVQAERKPRPQGESATVADSHPASGFSADAAAGLAHQPQKPETLCGRCERKGWTPECQGCVEAARAKGREPGDDTESEAEAAAAERADRRANGKPPFDDRKIHDAISAIPRMLDGRATALEQQKSPAYMTVREKANALIGAWDAWQKEASK